MAAISFANFRLSLNNLSVEDAMPIKKRLAAGLVKKLLLRVPEADRVLASEQLNNIALDLDGIKDKTQGQLVDEVLLPQFANDDRMKEILTALSLELIGNATKVSAIIKLDKPLKNNPELREEYRRAKVEAFGTLINLSEAAINKIADSSTDIDEISDQVLQSLVADQLITTAQKKNIQRITDLSILSGENLGLVKALNNDDVTITSFIDWDTKDWKELIVTHQIPIPEGEKSVDSYAANLTKNMEKSFPQPFYLNRVLHKKDFSAQLNTFDSFERISELGSISFESGKIQLKTINWAGINQEEKNKLQKDISDLQLFCNGYKYLGIQEVLANEQIGSGGKKEIIKNRINQLKIFYQKNEQVDFSKHDFFKPTVPLDFSGVEETNRPFIKAQAMALQRMHNLGARTSTALSLLEAGFSSSREIVKLGEANFLDISGLERTEAKKVYADALNNATATSHFLQAIRDAQLGGFRSLAVSNLSSIANDLREIDGYDALFGNQDYCDCEHCKSIFSPAAYFTDLMLFADKHVTKRVFTSELADHPLQLKSRRADLWKLPMTCQNTSTEIPYLNVVNDVLEQYIKTSLADEDVYETLASSTISCSLPFNLPLQKLRTYLGHFQLSLSGIYQLLGLPKAIVSQEALGISDKELDIIGTIDLIGTLRCFGNPSNLNDLSIADFLRCAAIERGELDDLLSVKFIPAIADVTIETIESTADIQQYTEKFRHNSLTRERLDFMHRYLRLWKKTTWSIASFDRVMEALKGAEILVGLEEKDEDENYKWLILSDVVGIQNDLKLTVEELCAVIDEMQEPILNGDTKGFYERTFNLDAIFGKDAATQQYNTETILINNRSEDKITPYLLAGLSINEHELNLLFGMIGVDNISSPVNLNKSVLSQLYRHARVAVGLRLSIESYVFAIRISLGQGGLTSIDKLVQLIACKKWLATTPFNFPQLDFIINGTESREYLFNYNPENVARLVGEIKNSAVNTDLSSMDIFKKRLMEEFHISQTQLTEDYLRFITIDIADPEIEAVFGAADPTPDALLSISDIFNQLQRKAFYFDKLKWMAEDVSFIRSHPTVFRIGSLANWTLNNLQAMISYTSLLTSKQAATKIELRRLLADTTGIGSMTPNNTGLLATMWNLPVELIQSVIRNVTFTGSLPEAINQLHDATVLCLTLGIQGESLIKLKEKGYANVVEASEVIEGAFTSKYAEEKIRNEKLEPYHDRLNTLRRDAFCNYIVAQRGDITFDNRNDLYYFFLLDVEMSGCFRTSKLLAAISSLQLYIHRCLMNLEQSEDRRVHVEPGFIPVIEWEWRMNYRVWEANRKVFLYPENYLEPELRDTKTPQFKELEDELLQQNVSMDTAEAAYIKYMAQFQELANVRYAGAYFHAVDFDPVTGVNTALEQNIVMNLISESGFGESESFRDKTRTCYNLFARTHLSPHQYYYRTYHPFLNRWGHWEKIDLPIEAEEVSSIVYNGNLYVYWTEIQHKEITTILGGEASSEKVVFKVSIKYSFLTVDNKWATPQRLFIGNVTESNLRLSLRVGMTNDSENLDAAIEKFKQEVFHKPYVSFTNSPNYLAVRHIYAPLKKIQTNKYRVIAFDHTVFTGSRFLRLEVSEQIFFVVGDKFHEVPAKTELISGGSVEISIESLVRANVSFFIGGVKMASFTRPVELVSSGSVIEIRLTKYKQSLYRNVNEPDRNFIAGADSLPLDMSDTFIKECIGVIWNANHVRFVENGSRNFVDSNRSIEQSSSGRAHLNTDEENNSLIILSTVLTNHLNQKLSEKGFEEFLSLQTQNISTDSGQKMNFTGPYGAYYWEMFFHIPFLIADNLNANQDFKGAKWWYERIFNPTSPEKPMEGIPGEHYWQFREFRGLDAVKLTDILSDESAIVAYKNDPFDPHAIARLRICGYQKAIVMKYIDNLLDWGDFLFAQDTQESIVEASMHYQLALDILGKRPAKVGKCKTENEEDLTFERIMLSADSGSEFLITLENVYASAKNKFWEDKTVLENSKYLSDLIYEKEENISTPINVVDLAVLSNATYHTDLRYMANTDGGGDTPATERGWVRPAPYTEILEAGNQERIPNPRPISGLESPGNTILYEDGPSVPAPEIADQSILAFCVPPNSNLFQYWDRVEDRLYKIRHCMNISGIRRSLALFQPPLDPMLLVRAKAAGIIIEDILAEGGSLTSLPNYRFVYMLEKAKQFTQNVQSFGASLLSALEKKDGEELLLLRSVHERNILRLTSDIKNKQVQEAQKQYNAASEGLTNIENRIDYYQRLIEEGLTGWELTEQRTKRTATIQRVYESALLLKAGLSYMIPQLGSPFSLNWGGEEMGHSYQAYAQWQGSIASVLDSVSSSAALEAGFNRRKEEWNFQLLTAKQELKQATQQLVSADIRIKIAERDLQIHDKAIEQAGEIDEFFRIKFTNLDLYNYMATTLHRLHRQSYAMALEMAKSAEICFKNELGEESKFIENDVWLPERAGLLSGEKLSFQLNRMEQEYMRLYKRCPEISQNFSLALLNPAELLKLRQTGKCKLILPEIAFDMMYPGQYRRLIRGVRLTIPCITGPYTNISANLKMIRSESRLNEVDAELQEVMIGKETSISTSSANSDSGTFEFNFRDERYLPFEYAGAISEWELSLPNKIRSFNYDTISDVILQLSYTAKEGDREIGETKVMTALNDYASNNGLFRIISLKQEFPNEYHVLMNSGNQMTEFILLKDHFPYFLIDRTLIGIEIVVLIKPKVGNSVAIPEEFKIDENPVEWDPEIDIYSEGNTTEINRIKGGKFNFTGTPIKRWKIESSEGGMNNEETDDIILIVKYSI